jgi:8-oxo-dGTP pyrophosphatase MutT (NUDIX family)
MSSLADNPAFCADYERLRDISLNPARHAAPNAHEHCEMVRRRAAELAALNHCTVEETALLSDLAHVHDIGKITGTANPGESVALLPKYGVVDERLINLVKYHDANLPWYQAAQRGEPPSDKAWNKLARKVDIRLLCLFMVADRVDCPGGWRANRPLVWFLEEVKHRNLLQADLVLDDGPEIPPRPGQALEVSAGVVLVQNSGGEVQALLIRVRKEGYEVPKGHVEPDEAKEAAALRELREETAIVSPVNMGPEIGVLDYTLEREGIPVKKRVHFFAARIPQGESVQFGERPKRTKELRWVKPSELAALPLVNEELRSIIARALAI